MHICLKLNYFEESTKHQMFWKTPSITSVKLELSWFLHQPENINKVSKTWSEPVTTDMQTLRYLGQKGKLPIWQTTILIFQRFYYTGVSSHCEHRELATSSGCICWIAMSSEAQIHLSAWAATDWLTDTQTFQERRSNCNTFPSSFYHLAIMWIGSLKVRKILKILLLALFLFTLSGLLATLLPCNVMQIWLQIHKSVIIECELGDRWDRPSHHDPQTRGYWY